MRNQTRDSADVSTDKLLRASMTYMREDVSGRHKQVEESKDRPIVKMCVRLLSKELLRCRTPTPVTARSMSCMPASRILGLLNDCLSIGRLPSLLSITNVRLLDR